MIFASGVRFSHAMRNRMIRNVRHSGVSITLNSKTKSAMKLHRRRAPRVPNSLDWSRDSGSLVARYRPAKRIL
jgi:hypothetical protein